VFVKGSTWRETVSQVVKIKVTVCGNEAVTNEDPENLLFSILEIGTPFSLQANWLSFDLTGVYSTASALLPTNECPVTQFQVC